MDRYSKRLRELLVYPFEKLDRAAEEVRNKGIKTIDFGVGDPDFPPPEILKSSLIQAIDSYRYYAYPSYTGEKSLRKAFCEYFRNRFGVELDYETECLVLIGTKEGIAHLPAAIINPGDLVMGVSPGYPVYKAGTLLADGIYKELPLVEENRWLPSVLDIDKNAKLLFLNSPSNPTGTIYPDEIFQDMIDLSLKNNTIIANDAAYSEIYFDTPPKSILEFKNAKKVAVEFHSASKTFSVPGFRIGFLVGNSDVISALSAVKRNIDSGQFIPLQLALVNLYSTPSVTELIRNRYSKRRELFLSNLPDWELPSATFYLWKRIKDGYTSSEFCRNLIESKGIIALPGNGLGTTGEGYVRFSLTLDESDIIEGSKRIAHFLKNKLFTMCLLMILLF